MAASSNSQADTAAIRRAVAAERERCARIADAYAADAWGMTEEESAAQKIAELIRESA